jgi:DNA polymerase III epsilon subunit-like protein
MLVIVDTETTGLSNRAQVVSFAAIAVGEAPECDTVLADCIVRPVREGWQLQEETEHAFSVNGHTIEQVEAAGLFLPMVWLDFTTMLRRRDEPITLLAHNAEFDRRLLQQSLGIDACAYFIEAEVPRGLWACSRLLPWPTPSRSLDAICAHYSISTPAARHTALGDCQRLIAAMRALHADLGVDNNFQAWACGRLTYLP